MKFSKEIGRTLAETLEELFILEELQLDEIRDPTVLKAEIKRLETSTHQTAAARLERLQRLHDRKLASMEARAARQNANQTKMHEIAKSHGYKAVKGKEGHYHRDGHRLVIGPGNKWSHRQMGHKRSVIGKTPIRTLMQHLKSLHEDTTPQTDLNEGAFSVSNTGSGWAVTSGPRGAKRIVAGPFPSKYAASRRKQQMLARIVGAVAPQQQQQQQHPMMGESEIVETERGQRTCPTCKNQHTLYSKCAAPCAKWDPAQEPPVKATVCYNCGHLKKNHKTRQ